MSGIHVQRREREFGVEDWKSHGKCIVGTKNLLLGHVAAQDNVAENIYGGCLQEVVTVQSFCGIGAVEIEDI